MIKKLAGILLLATVSLSTFGQTTAPKRSARPDIPGTFTLELGVNRGLDAPSNWDLGLWGSRTVNLYYQYEFPILQSRISFVPGIGLSLERYKLRNENVVNYANAERSAIHLRTPAEIGIPVQKSHFITNYVDVPVELRYSSKPEDPARSFKISVGGRIGYLYDALSKVKYKEAGEVRQFKDKQNFNLNRLRYGVYGKVGFGNFSLFGYYNITPLFESNKGFYNGTEPINFNTMTVGISLAAF